MQRFSTQCFDYKECLTGTVFALSGLLSAGFTRGRHLSWIVFWAIAGLSFYRAAMAG